jgi:hypothetical protein
MEDKENKKPTKPSKPKKTAKKPVHRKKKPVPKKPEKERSDLLDPMAVRSLSAFFAQHDEDPRSVIHRQHMKAMCSHVEEYLSNFILIGYTVTGEPVNITCAKSQKDMDSLSTSLQRYIFDCYSKFPPPPPGSFE